MWLKNAIIVDNDLVNHKLILLGHPDMEAAKAFISQTDSVTFGGGSTVSFFHKRLGDIYGDIRDKFDPLNPLNAENSYNFELDEIRKKNLQ